MFDKDNIQHNLKTGADSDLIFTREVTGSKENNGKLILTDGIRKYPYLARTTGNSIKGMTEQITSNELRKGRTKSAPRQGNSSAEGSLDFELSPTTFDDNLEAVFRNSWKLWKSDTDSAINLDKNVYAEGHFMTRATEEGEKNYNPDEGFGSRKLLSEDGTGADGGLIAVPKGCVVHELTCGTEDIKYSVLRKMGGIEGEDLFQEFKHMAINSMNLDMQIGAIVTGSFDFMGNNNPKLLREDAIKTEFGGAEATRFADGKTTGNDYIDNLPVKATNTDQFTTREGDLWINGKNITFAESLSFSINNGLEKKFALFVKNAISTQPLSLDVTGNLQTYVVAGESDELYNIGVDDGTNEIIFALEDKEVNPEFIYVFQIFKTKFSDQDVSMSGADTISQNHPWNSFEERAVRVFRIALPKPASIDFSHASSSWTDASGKYEIRANVPLTEETAKGIVVTLDVRNEANESVLGFPKQLQTGFVYDNGVLKIDESEQSLSALTDGVIRELKVELNGETLVKSFGETDKPKDPVITSVDAAETSLTVNWTASGSKDVDHYELTAKTSGENAILGRAKASAVSYVFKNLKSQTSYDITLVAVDKRGNVSGTVSHTESTTGGA